MSTIRVISWNVNGFSPSERKFEFIRSLSPDLVFLIEVTPEFNASVKSGGYVSSMACSLDYCFGADARKRPLGCVIGTNLGKISEAGLLPGMPVAERSLVAKIEIGSAAVDLCAFHAPPGVNWGSTKSDSFAALARWLENRDGPAILGMDANSPKIDHPSHAESVFWRANEDQVLGVDARHSLRDVYRSFLEHDAAAMKKLASDRPTGPLATSYDRGRGKPIPCRYDFVMASPEFAVRHVEYPLERSLQAGSDHSAVIAELEIEKMYDAGGA